MAKKVAKAKRKAAKGSKAAKATAGAEAKIQQEAKKAAAEDEDADEADEAADEDAEEDEEDEEDEEGEEATGAARKTKARRLEQALAKDGDEGPQEPKGVIYLGHVPKGFAEPQMRKFFSQFGRVTRLRLSRSKKNAGSKGYAFVEFEEESVAQIVADTMHKYLMFGKQLVCHLMPKDKQHPALFKDWKRRMVNFSNSRRRKARERHNNRPTVEVDGDVLPQVTLRQATRRRKASKKLKDVLQRLEVDYDPSLVDDDGAGDEDGVISGAVGQAGAGARGKKRRQATDGAEEGAAEPSKAVEEEPGKAAKAAGKKPKKKRKAA